MSSWSPTKYKTRNWPSYNTALKQRGSLSIWFDPEMSWHAPPTGKRGRPPAFNDAAIQVCLTMKVLFGMPLRQTTGFVESLLRLAGLDWKVPDFSTLCRRQKTLNVSIEVVLVFRPFCSPVKVDQGFMSGCYSRWFCLAGIGLVGGQDAVGRVRALGAVISHPLSDAHLCL